MKNVGVSGEAVRLALGRLPADRRCGCQQALQDALVTRIDLVPTATRQKLAPLIARHAGQMAGSGR